MLSPPKFIEGYYYLFSLFNYVHKVESKEKFISLGQIKGEIYYSNVNRKGFI